MIAGAHFLLCSKDPEADRGFFKTVLKFPSVDLGDGWLIFALAHAELAVHPGDGEFVQTHAEHPMLGGLLRAANRIVKSKVWRGQTGGSRVGGRSVWLPSGGEMTTDSPCDH